jgi:hypothetical protein
MDRAKNRDHAAYPGGGPHDRIVRMFRENDRYEALKQSAGDPREQIQTNKLFSSHHFLDRPAEEIKTKAIEKHMPWPRDRMKELEC